MLKNYVYFGDVEYISYAILYYYNNKSQPTRMELGHEVINDMAEQM